jgi:hypothetical protein
VHVNTLELFYRTRQGTNVDLIGLHRAGGDTKHFLPNFPLIKFAIFSPRCVRVLSCAGHSLGELEALLETIMLEDFNVQAEDGSPAQVGQTLLHWYQKCLAGDFALIEQLRNVSSGAKRSRGEMVRSCFEYGTLIL